MAPIFHTISIYPYPISGLSAIYDYGSSSITVTDCNDHYELRNIADGTSVIISAPEYNSITVPSGTGSIWFGNIYAWHSSSRPDSALDYTLYTNTLNPTTSSVIYNEGRWDKTSIWQYYGSFTNASSSAITYVKNNTTYTYNRYEYGDIINKKPENLYAWDYEGTIIYTDSPTPSNGAYYYNNNGKRYEQYELVVGMYALYYCINTYNSANDTINISGDPA